MNRHIPAKLARSGPTQRNARQPQRRVPARDRPASPQLMSPLTPRSFPHRLRQITDEGVLESRPSGKMGIALIFCVDA